MPYETELNALKTKKEYWKSIKVRDDFHGGIKCPTGKWTTVWEETSEGLYVLCDHYTYTEVTLYGSEGQTYSIYNNFGIHDWNIFRELYVAGYESKKFRTEAPFYQETIMIDEEYWSFIVTAPPTGEYGVNIWDTSIDQGFSDEFVSTLIEQAPIITALKTITEKYGTGMTPKIFCAGNILKNSSGYYWTFLTDYTYSYERCLRIGYANAKHVNSKKYKLIKGMLDINNASANDAVDHKQTAINIVDQFFNSISESK